MMDARYIENGMIAARDFVVREPRRKTSWDTDHAVKVVDDYFHDYGGEVAPLLVRLARGDTTALRELESHGRAIRESLHGQ